MRFPRTSKSRLNTSLAANMISDISHKVFSQLIIYWRSPLLSVLTVEGKQSNSSFSFIISRALQLLYAYYKGKIPISLDL